MQIKTVARLLPALLLAFILAAPGGARAGFTKSRPVAPQTAPAIVQDKGEDLQRSILAKLEFEELNLQLIGMTPDPNKATCTIKHPGSTEQMTYNVGDVIGGYRVAAIADQQVKFERAGREFFIQMGESSGGHDMLTDAPPSPADAPVAADGLKKQPVLAGMEDAPPAAAPAATAASIVEKRDQAFKDATTKLAKVNLKTKTRRFETARLIEDGFAVKDVAPGRITTRAPRALASAEPIARSTTSGSVGGSGFMPPLQGELSSEYGYRRHPIGGDWRFHRGIDIAGPYGASICSAAEGVVTKVEQTYSLGKHIVIQHSSGFETVYGHLSSQLVQVGQRIQRGQLIGREGNTGSSTGPHLHFEIHYNGQTVNPINYLRGLH